MKIRIVIFAMCMAFLVSTSSAFAYTDCVRKVRKVWVGMDGQSVWVVFEQAGHGHAFQDASNPNTVAKDRFYTMALTALTTNKTVIVRYPEDNADCSSQPARKDILGMWISNQ